jgi:hypothetical protein
MATPIKINKQRHLTDTEERLVDAFLATGDINIAAQACELPVTTAQAFLERPHVKRLIQHDSGYVSAQEMTDGSLLDEILLATRGAVNSESYAAAMAGYKLFWDIRKDAKLLGPVTIEAEAEQTRARLRRLRDG